MKDLIKEMQRYYGRRAPVYDASMGYDNPETVAHLAPVLDRIRGLLDDRTVLEIACGPGFWTQQLCAVVRAMVSTDVNASTLAEAQRKALDPEKVTLLEADAYALPEFATTFDACLAVDWLCHVPHSRTASFFEGLHRKLAPGSRVVFCDQLPGDFSLTNDFDAEGNHLQERDLPDGSRCQIIKNFFFEHDLQELLPPSAREVDVQRFPECRRLVLSYVLGG